MKLGYDGGRRELREHASLRLAGSEWEEMSIEKFKEVLAKQKREDEVVRRQRSSRHELEESLLHKQHDVELVQAIQSRTPAVSNASRISSRSAS